MFDCLRRQPENSQRGSRTKQKRTDENQNKHRAVHRAIVFHDSPRRHRLAYSQSPQVGDKSVRSSSGSDGFSSRNSAAARAIRPAKSALMILLPDTLRFVLPALATVYMYAREVRENMASVCCSFAVATAIHSFSFVLIWSFRDWRRL